MLLTALLYTCGFNKTIEITPRYFVIQVDVPDDTDLCYKLNDGNYLGLLGGNLTNLYRKGNLLIATKTTKGKIVVKEYYIIHVLNYYMLDPAKTVKGPFDFARLKQELSSLGSNIDQFEELNIGL